MNASPRPAASSDRPSLRRVLFALGSLAAAAVAGLVLWVALGPGALWVLEHADGVKDLKDAELAEALDRVRGRAVAIGTGLLAVVAIFFTARTARAALDSSSAAQQTAAATERGMVTGRFTAAVTQLGDPSPAIRLGGVHALAGIADDEPSMRQTCIDVLCAYLRLPYDPDPGQAPGRVEERKRYRGRREVRHTIIRLIGNHLRLPDDHPHCWCGHDFDFTDVVFDGGDLHGARFTAGTTSFHGAHFSGGTVDFKDAEFSGGTVIFTNAKFSSSMVVTFTNAVFSGGTVDFKDAEFSDGTVTFASAKFSGSTVTFTNAVFSGGIVGFGSATFSGGLVDFRDAEFSGSTVTFVNASGERPSDPPLKPTGLPGSEEVRGELMLPAAWQSAPGGEDPAEAPPDAT